MATGYSVTSVNQTQQLDSAGHLVDVVNVLFELDNGAGSGSVTVPLTADWETAAGDAVQKQAQSMLNLLSM